MRRRVHNTDFDILLRSVHYYPKLQIPKIHKNIQNKCVLSVQLEFGVRILFKLYLAQNFQLCLGIPHPISPYPNEQISNQVHNVITCRKYVNKHHVYLKTVKWGHFSRVIVVHIQYTSIMYVIQPSYIQSHYSNAI